MDSFYDEQKEASRIKAEIVAKYFAAWARVVGQHSDRIGYVDFFAGPGRYEDGQESTPLMVLESAVKSEIMRRGLVAVFNEANGAYAARLKSEIGAVEGIERMKYEPQVISTEIDERLVREFEQLKSIPALSFIDPWGYKGLSARLIEAVLKDWGCEVVFFFNYDRINRDIANPKVEVHMEALFGGNGLRMLRQSIDGSRPGEREISIKRGLRERLMKMGVVSPLTFTFRRDDGRVSHYICFVTKSPRGYHIMKEVMAKQSAVDPEGIPLFEYTPSTREQLRMMGDSAYSLSILAQDLMDRFAGKMMTVIEIYETHSMSEPYLKKNYKDALTQLESEGKVSCAPAAEKRPKNTLADWIPVTFP